ncbi:hypothetical protein PIB30_069024, partial [Stylosanthes scabra]|nr:hypothetical protein [Stylosanthes scabra]
MNRRIRGLRNRIVKRLELESECVLPTAKNTGSELDEVNVNEKTSEFNKICVDETKLSERH